MPSAVRIHAVESLLAAAVTWAGSRADILGLCVVGSYARGSATEDSDVDIVVIAEDQQPLLDDARWTGGFGTITSCERRDFGLVQSVCATYATGLEVEWCITDRRWVSTDPVDAETRAVVLAGASPLYDPHGLVRAFLTAASVDTA